MRNLKLLQVCFCFSILSLLINVTKAQNFHSIAKINNYSPSIKFSHNGKLIACCNMAANDAVGSLDIYDSETGKLASTIVCNPMFVSFSPKDDIVMVKMDQKSFAFFDITDLERPKQMFSTKLDNIISGDMSMDGKYYALGTNDGAAVVLSTQTGKVMLATYPFPNGTYTSCCYGSCKYCPVYSIKLLSENRLLVAGAGMSGKVSILNFNGEVIYTTWAATGITACSVDDSSKHLVVNSGTNSTIYSISGYPNRISKIGNRVYTLKYSPSGNNILDFRDEKIIVYDSEGKKMGKISAKGYTFPSTDGMSFDISTNEKKVAFVYEHNLVVGDFEAIKAAGK
ncbi:MAG: WD40 repeat domain-containing protein [Ferruginibacter sp.]